MDQSFDPNHSRPAPGSSSPRQPLRARPFPLPSEIHPDGLPDSFQPEIPPHLVNLTPREPLLTPGELWSRSVLENHGQHEAPHPAASQDPPPPSPALPPSSPLQPLLAESASPPYAESTSHAETGNRVSLQREFISVADAQPELFHTNPIVAPIPVRPHKLDRDAGIWLAGSGSDLLEACTKAEQRKHGALGLTILVPTSFALVASAYAVSTLTSNPWIIIPISLLWASIILLIDRSLLATYRSSLAPKWKAAQFGIRMTVAVLMGLTIAHPITLLLFKDTIAAQIAEERDRDISALRATAAQDKAVVEEKIRATQARIDEHRQAYHSSFQPSFLSEDPASTSIATGSTQLGEEDRELLAARLAQETLSLGRELATLDEERTRILGEQSTLKTELDHWQSAYEAELNGSRSGRPGIGPRARSIENDHLAWRRLEAARLSRELDRLGNTRFEIEATIQASQDRVRQEFATLASSRAEARRAEAARLAELRAQAQTTQLTSFVAGQDGVRDRLQAQIDAGLADLQLLREELAVLARSEKDRIATLQHEPRRDLLSQTLALHHLFGAGSEGGHFALLAYLILAGLFLTVDTIPILVKFTSHSGEYDDRLDQSHYEASLSMLHRRKEHLALLQQETLQKLDGTQEIFQREAELLRSRLELIDRQIEVAQREVSFRQEFGFAQRLPRAS